MCVIYFLSFWSLLCGHILSYFILFFPYLWHARGQTQVSSNANKTTIWGVGGGCRGVHVGVSQPLALLKPPAVMEDRGRQMGAHSQAAQKSLIRADLSACVLPLPYLAKLKRLQGSYALWSRAGGRGVLGILLTSGRKMEHENRCFWGSNGSHFSALSQKLKFPSFPSKPSFYSKITTCGVIFSIWFNSANRLCICLRRERSVPKDLPYGCLEIASLYIV